VGVVFDVIYVSSDLPWSMALDNGLWGAYVFYPSSIPATLGGNHSGW
jgi:hypothetical protein